MIEIPVWGSNVSRALMTFKEVCIRSGLAKDKNRHRYYEKHSTQRRKKHLRAFLKQKDINKKMERRKG